MREWRDVHSQLLTVVTEHGWRLNQSPATYEQLHLSMLAGLLGNIGQKSDDEDWYLGARGIKFYRHPGAHLSKKPGRWIVAAELVDTSRLYGRGIANIEPQWLPPIAGHLIKTQLLEPHWEKKAAEVVALERATLYGIVLYSNRTRELRPCRPQGRARDLHPRSAGRQRRPAGRPRAAAALPGPQPPPDRARWRRWSTSRAARTCWSTTS